MLSDFICIVILPTIYNNLEVLDCVDKNKYNNRSFILHQQTIKDRWAQMDKWIKKLIIQ